MSDRVQTSRRPRRSRDAPFPYRFLTELAEQLGTTQGIISDYECGKLRPHADMIVRLAKALRVSTDEMLGVKPPSKNGAATVSRRVLRRLTAIDGLPKRDQDALFRTIDAFLQARKAG